MNKRLLTAAMAALFFCASVAQAQNSAPRQTLKSQPTQQYQKMGQVLYLIANAYVDTVDMPKLVEGAIIEMLGTLDPHSVYIGLEDLKEETQEMEGNFEGIGIEFNVLHDTIIVVNTITGGPSEQVGLMPGDRIVSVNGISQVGIRTVDVPKILRGPKGTVAELKVVRPGAVDTLDFRIVRDKIPMHSLDAAYRIDKQTGYVKLNRFMATSNDELQQALNEMKGINGLILDLRGNGGGLLDQAIRVCGNFLDPNSLVVYTEGRAIARQEALTEPETNPDTGKSQPPLFNKEKLVVLVDEHSASASEIVAGAIQDWDRGKIVGRRTFGKGLVQQQIGLGDGSAIRITVAHYYTPSGRSIQRPYKEGDAMSYYRDFANRYTSGELTGGTVVAEDSSAIYHTLVKKRPVYGGGGITPDVIVPLDTTAFSAYWGRLVRAGVMLEAVISDLDQHRANYHVLYPDFDTYARDFTVTPEMLDRLTALGVERGVALDPPGLERARRLIQVQWKALIAQRLWSTSEYYRVLNAELDPEFQAALSALRGK